MPDRGPDLPTLLDELALANPGVRRTAIGDAVDFAWSGRVFAAVDPVGHALFRLRPDVARAALRTAGVSASERGPDWIVLAPETTDRYARDRAAAWFEHARRLAESAKLPN